MNKSPILLNSLEKYLLALNFYVSLLNLNQMGGVNHGQKRKESKNEKDKKYNFYYVGLLLV